MSRLLEICCDSLNSVLAAARGGADRIELCSCLECDGLTPGAGLLTRVLESVDIPVFAMVRPRSGDFVYAHEDLSVMLAEIDHLSRLGACGIVSGALTEDNEIDLKATEQLVKASGNLPFTFHRAFDSVSDPIEALGQLAELGVARVLTSGGGKEADVTALERYQKAAPTIRILACGGVRAANIESLLVSPHLLEFHSAALQSDSCNIACETDVRNMAQLVHRA